MSGRCVLSVASAVVVVALLSNRSRAQDPDVNVTTWQNDMSRTGQNLDEVKLVKSALQSTTNPFGQLCNIQVDGQVYAQPLVVADVTFGSTTYASVALCGYAE